MLLGLSPINGMQNQQQELLAGMMPQLRSSLGGMPPATWKNLDELNGAVEQLLSGGRAASAAAFLVRAYPSASRPWPEADRIATLYLHLGEPSRARAIWEGVSAPPKPAVRDARLAAAHFIEGDIARARETYANALAADPDLFEALYGLAVLEQDVGRAPESLAAARRALAVAPDDIARAATRGVIAVVTPYASSRLAR
jgi:tetratricopeptide (TPR) repeat protein